MRRYRAHFDVTVMNVQSHYGSVADASKITMTAFRCMRMHSESPTKANKFVAVDICNIPRHFRHPAIAAQSSNATVTNAKAL